MDNRDRIAKPWCVKLEMSHGCNLACKFCPVGSTPSLRDPEQRSFMEPSVLQAVCEQLADLEFGQRIELTLRGEPTLNPEILENLTIMRELLPYAQITMFSNGVTFFKNPELITAMMSAGLNVLAIDCYNNTMDRFRSIARNVIAEDPSISMVPIDNINLYSRHSHGNSMKAIVLVPDINSSDTTKVRNIHNMAGNVKIENLSKTTWSPSSVELPLHKNCARPYRELVIYHNGIVPICCYDWFEEGIMGNIYVESIEEIWYGDRHLAMLRSLWAKDRSGAPCYKCDYFGGYRLGFLQDPTG